MSDLTTAAARFLKSQTSAEQSQNLRRMRALSTDQVDVCGIPREPWKCAQQLSVEFVELTKKFLAGKV